MNWLKLRLIVFWAGALGGGILFFGCSEQPQGYIFSPQQRDMTAVTRQAVDFLNNLYDHTDQAIEYLTAAAYTPEYRSIFPPGWRDFTNYDNSTGRPIGQFYRYLYSYLDQKISLVEFPTFRYPQAVRHPSQVRFTYVEFGSYQNRITSEFYANARIVKKLEIGYERDFQNIDFMEGWFSYQRSLPFDYDIEVAVPGQGSATVSQRFYLPATWTARIERYSTAVKDYQARVVIDGIYPMLDRAGNYQEPHVSGEFIINRSGSGTGEIWLYGEKTSQVTFTGRGYGFQGYFTLYSENHKTRYNF